MSKPKTFLKYLPAEGEIKNTRQMIGESVAMEAVRRTMFPERYAVTSDIEVGDEVMCFTDGNKYKISGYIYHKIGRYPNKKYWEIWDERLREYLKLSRKNCFKVLAPISKNVTWDIPDGAEIEVEPRLKEHYLIGGALKLASKGEVAYYLVKGPCGHYH